MWKLGLVLILVSGMGLVFQRLSDHTGSPAADSERERSVKPQMREHSSVNTSKRRLMEKLRKVEHYHRHLDATVWSQEKMAQRYGEWVVKLWDRLRSTSEKVKMLARVDFGSLWLGRSATHEQVESGITRIRYTKPSLKLGPSDWSRRAHDYYERGYRVDQTEWRHVRFEPGTGDKSPYSRIAFRIHVRHEERRERIILRGILRTDWKPLTAANACPSPKTIRVVKLRMLKRSGAPFFRRQSKRVLSSHDPLPLVGPLVAEDLNGDDRLEIIACVENRLFWNRGDWQWEEAPIVETPERVWYTSAILELTGDRALDLLTATETGLFLYHGKESGGFQSNGERVWKSPKRLLNPFVLTAGDVDGDQDIDIWLGQYKQPYVAGQMPTPYYNANDGFAAYFLKNRGDCRFVEATASAGLDEKRFRRTYAASFADLDGDLDLDLLVVSDFAGVDIYQNNGNGRFTDVTKRWVDQPKLFGMGHAIADVNNDGRLDIYATGMTSPVAERLDYLGLGEGLRSDYKKMRPIMSYGNRLYMKTAEGFRQSPYQDDVNDSGWSWGVTAFDAENDGDLDLYVANGHKSRESVRDYDWRFWCHDIYAGSSSHSRAKDFFFRSSQRRYFGRGDSHAGYQKNRLFLKRDHGNGFLEASYLMGTALEEDCRSLVSADLDNDGRKDLAVMTYQSGNTKEKALHLFRNVGASRNHWIGFDLTRKAGSGNGLGASVELVTDRGKRKACRVIGDSFRSQHSSRIHFGLGERERVQRAFVRWVDGTSTLLKGPKIDKYHKVP